MSMILINLNKLMSSELNVFFNVIYNHFMHVESFFCILKLIILKHYSVFNFYKLENANIDCTVVSPIEFLKDI